MTSNGICFRISLSPHIGDKTLRAKFAAVFVSGTAPSLNFKISSRGTKPYSADLCNAVFVLVLPKSLKMYDWAFCLAWK